MKCAQLGLELNALDGIYLTHLHGDHIGGIPILLVHLHFVAGRDRPLVIAGPVGMKARLKSLWASAYPSVLNSGLRFDVNLIEWPVPGTMDILSRHVTTLRARHDSHAVAASIRIQTDENDLAFSGDTGWQDALADFVDGSQIFICECSNVSAAYRGHLSVEELRIQRFKIQVGQLYLSHLSEKSRAAAEQDATTLQAIVADDGMVVDLSDQGQSGP